MINLSSGGNMINILIAEDDSEQRKNLVKMIYEADIDLKIYEAESKEEALKISIEVYIDFFYIDISLKNSSGLDLALELREIEKYKFNWIIFITTHVQYMIQAFKEVHCYDYILKPYDKDEVIKMTKLLTSNNHVCNSLIKEEKYVVFDLQNSISIKLNVDEIVFMEVSFRKIILHTKNGNYEAKRLSLNKALKMINYEHILQSHKSFAININFINKIEAATGKIWEISFNNCKEKALLSYNFKEIVMKKFNENVQATF
jgi:two-component system LytT family response regulator